MKSRSTLASIASLFAATSLLVIACQSDDEGNSNTTGGGGNAQSAGGSSAGTNNNQGGNPGNPGGSNPGGQNPGGSDPAGGSGGSGGGECGGITKTLAELNSQKAPLEDRRVRIEGVVATSHKFLVSPSASGCLWGVYVTTAGADVAEYGSIMVTSKGPPPVTNTEGKTVCTNEQQDTVIPGDVAPGDLLNFSGYLDEFLQKACSEAPNVAPKAGQRQIGGTSCMTKAGTGAIPKAHALSNEQLTDIASGNNTDDQLYKWGGAPVELSGVTTKTLASEKYYNCSAVSGFGDLVFDQTTITVNNGIYYNDVTCAGPRDGNKRYDFLQPTTFDSIVGLLAVDFCTWQVSVPTRCDSIAPVSPTCGKLTEDKCAKVIGATECPPENTVAQCTDGVDNNSNSFIDCEDKGCCDVVDCKTTAPDSYCGKGGGTGGAGGGSGGKGENTAELCQDGQDNDGDKFTDCDDFECCDLVDCKVKDPTSSCATKGQGGSGGAAGAGGGTPENTAALCADGQDNDKDNFIDCEDKDCCKLVDCSSKPDSYCGKQAGAVPENTAALCADGVDNDKDNFIDCEDKDCCKLVDCKATKPDSYCGKQP